MRQFLLGAAVAIICVASAAAWVWFQRPDLLPESVQQQNVNSPKYAPAVYRWKDAQGRTQIGDVPPIDHPYETVRIDPNTNVVPDTLPTARDTRDE